RTPTGSARLPASYCKSSTSSPLRKIGQPAPARPGRRWIANSLCAFETLNPPCAARIAAPAPFGYNAAPFWLRECVMAVPQYVFVMKGLSKTFPGGRQILKDIWLSFLPGAKIGVIGVNGSGKSTLLKLMAGIDKEFTGEAWA